MAATRQKKLYNSTLLLGTSFAPHTNVGYSELERAMRKFITRNGWTTLDTLLGVVRTRYTALATIPVALAGGDVAKLDKAGKDLYVGQSATAIPGDVDGIPDIAVTYQWMRNGSATGMSGKTTQTYVLVSGDIGTAITCVVTYTNTAGNIAQTTAALGTITAAP